MSSYINNNKSSSAGSGGACISTILQVVFIVLKLVHVIDWSWWWVLAPTWISLVFAVVAFIIFCIIKKIVKR